MPKSSLDWLGVVCAWVGSIVLAIRSAGAPLLPGAPSILTANFWNFVPAALLSIALAIFIYRQLRPVSATAVVDPQASPKPKASVTIDTSQEKRAMPFGAPVRSPSKWLPDIPLSGALTYLRANPGWHAPYIPSAKDAFVELHNALIAGKTTAWGKEHPSDDDLKQIPQLFWSYSELKPDTNYAFSRHKSRPAYDIHLSKEEMKLIWPPKA